MVKNDVIAGNKILYLVTTVTMEWRKEPSKTVKQIYAATSYPDLLRGIAGNIPGPVSNIHIERFTDGSYLYEVVSD